jgi:hypothetical protein
MSGSGADQGTGVTAVAVLRSAGEPGKASPMAREQLVVARVATVALCGVAIALGILFKGQNIAFLVGLPRLPRARISL